MKRLLDWIDRADMASQMGAPKPAFQTEESERIFPEGDEPWWLTELQKRAAPEDEPAPCDEDGPPSCDDGQAGDEAFGCR